MGTAFVISGIITVVRRLRRPVDSQQTAELHALLRDSVAFTERWPADRRALAPLTELQDEVDRCNRMIYRWQYLRTLPRADAAGLDAQIAAYQGRLAAIHAVVVRHFQQPPRG